MLEARRKLVSRPAPTDGDLPADIANELAAWNIGAGDTARSPCISMVVYVFILHCGRVISRGTRAPLPKGEVSDCQVPEQDPKRGRTRLLAPPLVEFLNKWVGRRAVLEFGHLQRTLNDPSPNNSNGSPMRCISIYICIIYIVFSVYVCMYL